MAKREGKGMRKITFILGAGIGFLLGSKAGNGPYEQVEAKLREAIKRPKPQPTEVTILTVDADDDGADIVPITDSLTPTGPSGAPTP
jgi:hypothetical protein